MSDGLTLTVESGASESEAHVQRLLIAENTELGFEYTPRTFCAVLRDHTGDICGGIKAQSHWGWLYVAELVVIAKWQGRGHGNVLLTAAESWGIESSCHGAWLSTLSLRARRFYERRGYEVFGELPDSPGPQTRFFMRRSLGLLKA